MLAALVGDWAWVWKGDQNVVAESMAMIGDVPPK
jgi:hypothetical protein